PGAGRATGIAVATGDPDRPIRGRRDVDPAGAAHGIGLLGRPAGAVVRAVLQLGAVLGASLEADVEIAIGRPRDRGVVVVVAGGEHRRAAVGAADPDALARCLPPEREPHATHA